MIDSYSTHGFRLNSGLFICGPAAFFPRTVMHWNVAGPWDVSVASLTLFWLLEPKPDVLVIGVGDKGQKISDDVRLFFHKRKISVEMLDTATACHAFNFMNADHRNVAAALIPVQTLRLYTDPELYESVMIKGRLGMTEGSSMNDVAEERERRMEFEGERAAALHGQGKYEPFNRILVADLKEMLEKGMITPEKFQERYPKLDIEAVLKSNFEDQPLLEAEQKKAIPAEQNDNNKQVEHQENAKISDKVQNDTGTEKEK
jgi:NADH dehydrogenase [ubiquinone] 1 alpha subcomplex assembly factor 3